MVKFCTRGLISLLLLASSLATIISLVAVVFLHHYSPHLLFGQAIKPKAVHYINYGLLGWLNFWLQENTRQVF